MEKKTKEKLKVGMTIVSSLVVTGILYLLCGYVSKNTDDSLISIWIVVSVYVCLVILFNFSKSKKIIDIVEKIEKREKTNTLLATIFLGLLVSAVLTNQTNQIAKQELKIANRETSPDFEIESYESEGGEGYKVLNKKGMASYVTLNVYETYHFHHKGIDYEIRYTFFNDEQHNEYNMNEEKTELNFLLENEGFDRETAYETVKKYVSEQLDDSVVISNGKEIELSFFDYKNEYFKFEFSEYDDQVKLVNTSGKVYRQTRNNTIPYWSEEYVETQIQEAVDSVVNGWTVVH